MKDQANTDHRDDDRDDHREPARPAMNRRAAVGTLLAALGGAAVIGRGQSRERTAGTQASGQRASGPQAATGADEPIWLGHL